MSDREKAGLHGPVRTCVEETILADSRKHLTTREYSPDGEILTARTTNSDGTEWIITKTYDVDGRLTKTISGNSQEPGLESVYNYDGAGRLVSIANSPHEGDRVDFRFDEQGRKTATQSFDQKTLQRAQNTAYAISAGTLLIQAQVFPLVAASFQSTTDTMSRQKRESSIQEGRLS